MKSHAVPPTRLTSAGRKSRKKGGVDDTSLSQGSIIDPAWEMFGLKKALSDLQGNLLSTLLPFQQEVESAVFSPIFRQSPEIEGSEISEIIYNDRMPPTVSLNFQIEINSSDKLSLSESKRFT